MPDHLPAVSGREREAAIALAAGADLLIHDSQFLSAERAIAESYGHATVEQAVQLATEAHVGALVLFHHAPGRTDEQLATIYREIDHADLRRDGLTVHLGRESDEFDTVLLD
jgi:ribonuclease BN (tRNA processing enzyme)